MRDLLNEWVDVSKKGCGNLEVLMQFVSWPQVASWISEYCFSYRLCLQCSCLSVWIHVGFLIHLWDRIVIQTTKRSQLQAPKYSDDDYSIAKWNWGSMNIYFVSEPCFNGFFLCDEANLIIQVLFKIFSSIHRIQVLFIAEITYFYILSLSNDI